MSVRNIPEEVYIDVILPFIVKIEPKELLLDWIDFDKLDWDYLSCNENPAAIELLKQSSILCQDKICRKHLSSNSIHLEKLFKKPNGPDLCFLSCNATPAAIELLKIKTDAVIWLASYPITPSGIELLKENPDKINWNWLSFNSGAIELLKDNPDKINWEKLSNNTNPEAIELIISGINLSNINNKPIVLNWARLSLNPAAIELLITYGKDKINWECLSGNSEAMDILKDNQDKIHWRNISANKSIFKNPAIAMKQKIQSFYNEYLL